MNPFIAQMKMFAGNFAPRGWAFCDGQILAISQFSALFSLIGTTYGGDGRVTFALPDLRGRLAVHSGRGPGLLDYRLGSRGGQEEVTLTTNELPNHTHLASGTATASDGTGNTHIPSGASFGVPETRITRRSTVTTNMYVAAPSNVAMGANATSVNLAATGGNLPHENRRPYLTVNYIIALVGIYPSRN